MWKTLYDSVRGTSHERSATPCQDNSAARVLKANDRTYLLASCADGAGTAEFSDHGSRIAVEGIIQVARILLENGLSLDEIDRAQMLLWYGEVRSRIDAEAIARQMDPRQLACTLLTAIVGHEGSAFAQIGDGAIIVGAGEMYEPVFWPQSGEYANTTNFLTDNKFAERVAFEYRGGQSMKSHF